MIVDFKCTKNKNPRHRISGSNELRDLNNKQENNIYKMQ